MSRGINKVILVGNLGNDPEVKTGQSGSQICNLSVATSESWKDKNTGEAVEKTEWHRVVGFNRLAEIMGQYLRKGSKVYIEGQLQTRKWQDQAGNDRYTTEIVARDMQMLDSRAGLPGRDQGQQGPAYQQSQQPYQAPPQQQAHPGGAQQQPMQQEAAPFDDDVPF